MNSSLSLDIVRSAVRAAATRRESGREGGKHAPPPVVTISREGGIDAASVARPLLEVLRRRFGDEPRWIAYDQQLVERVAADNDLSRDLVASLDERDKSWFEHFTAGLTGVDTGADVAMKTARTIRALSRMGHAVIVGRGSQFVLQSLPHVVHVRLVAPIWWRRDVVRRARGVGEAEAEKAVREIDDERARFIRHHFGQDTADPAHYHVVLNVARLRSERIASIVADVLADTETP